MLYIDDEQNITLTRGDTGIFNITLQNQNGKAYTPQQGDSLRFALSDGFGKEALVIKNIPINTCVLEIEPSDTANLKFKTYKYDIQFTSAQGKVSTIILGDFKVDNEVC